MSYFLTFSVTLYDFSLFSVCPKASDIITLKSKFSPHYIFFVVILTWLHPYIVLFAYLIQGAYHNYLLDSVYLSH